MSTAVPEDSRHRTSPRGDRDAAAGPSHASAREAMACLAAAQFCARESEKREPAEPWDSWPWLKRDGASGVPHYRPRDGAECAYLGLVICARCGWIDPDPERVQRARELLEDARRVMEQNSREPL